MRAGFEFNFRASARSAEQIQARRQIVLGKPKSFPENTFNTITADSITVFTADDQPQTWMIQAIGIGPERQTRVGNTDAPGKGAFKLPSAADT